MTTTSGGHSLGGPPAQPYSPPHAAGLAFSTINKVSALSPHQGISPRGSIGLGESHSPGQQGGQGEQQGAEVGWGSPLSLVCPDRRGGS